MSAIAESRSIVLDQDDQFAAEREGLVERVVEARAGVHHHRVARLREQYGMGRAARGEEVCEHGEDLFAVRAHGRPVVVVLAILVDVIGGFHAPVGAGLPLVDLDAERSPEHGLRDLPHAQFLRLARLA